MKWRRVRPYRCFVEYVRDGEGRTFRNAAIPSVFKTNELINILSTFNQELKIGYNNKQKQLPIYIGIIKQFRIKDNLKPQAISKSFNLYIVQLTDRGNSLLGTLVTSTNKTDHQDTTEILLQVSLNTHNKSLCCCIFGEVL